MCWAQDSGLENSRSGGAVAQPYLSCAAAFERVMRCINGIEQRLLLVEIGAIDFVAELDDPARLATPSTNLKLHRPHQRVPKKIRTAPGFQRQSIDTSFGGRQFHPRRMRLPTRTIPHATSGSVHRPR